MALDTYSGLQTFLAAQLNRSDLTGNIPDFITLAESEMQRKLRSRVRRDSLDLTGRVNSMPCAAKELRSIYHTDATTGRRAEIQISTPEEVAAWRVRQGGVAGRPVIAALTSNGNELIVAPAPDQTYTVEVVYFQALQALSASNTENDELREYPHMYVAGSLKYAESFLEHEEAAATRDAEFQQAIREANTDREHGEYGANPRPARLPVVIG